MSKTILNNIFLVVFCFLVFCFFPIHVFGIQINTPDTLSPQETDVPTFLLKFYEFAIVIGGIIAVLMIVAGAVYFTFFAGILKKQQGLDMVWGALWGLLLLLGSYLILKTINPELVGIKNPGEGIIKNIEVQKKENIITTGNIEIIPENK